MLIYSCDVQLINHEKKTTDTSSATIVAITDSGKENTLHLAESSSAPDLLGCLEPLSCYILTAGSPVKVALYFWVIYEHCCSEGKRSYVSSVGFFFFQVLIVGCAFYL